MWERATGPMELGPFGGGEVSFKIDETSLKFYPAQIHTQVPISLVLKLRERVPLEDVEAINLETYSRARTSAGSETEKWDPQTRETADHSIPYVVAVGPGRRRCDPRQFQSRTHCRPRAASDYGEDQNRGELRIHSEIS